MIAEVEYLSLVVLLVHRLCGSRMLSKSVALAE
jgi:hypothetical protein